VRARPEVETAKTVYLLQGEIGPGTRDGAIRMKAQGGGGPGPHTAALWLVYRVRSLDWPPEIVAEIGRRAIPEGVRRLREYVKRSGDLIEFRFKNSLAKAAKPHKRSLGT
jgi:hypothetical protein